MHPHNTHMLVGTEKEFPFVMCNMAPPDMVGHTGDMARAVEAVEATDKAIGEILDACQKYGYVLMVTSDHGQYTLVHAVRVCTRCTCARGLYMQ